MMTVRYRMGSITGLMQVDENLSEEQISKLVREHILLNHEINWYEERIIPPVKREGLYAKNTI